MHHIKFTTEGNEKMRIISDGKVGIGINAPTKSNSRPGLIRGT